jgi:hypothetical protein
VFNWDYSRRVEILNIRIPYLFFPSATTDDPMSHIRSQTAPPELPTVVPLSPASPQRSSKSSSALYTNPSNHYSYHPPSPPLSIASPVEHHDPWIPVPHHSAIEHRETSNSTEGMEGSWRGDGPSERGIQEWEVTNAIPPSLGESSKSPVAYPVPVLNIQPLSVDVLRAMMDSSKGRDKVLVGYSASYPERGGS